MQNFSTLSQAVFEIQAVIESIFYSLSRDIKFILLQLAHMDKIEMKAATCTAWTR